MFKRQCIILVVFTLLSCSEKENKNFLCESDDNALFELKLSEQTNITFNNQLEYSEAFNTYTYRNFYNGGGVALGDINNDGLIDIFFGGNMVSNKLYLNKDEFQFEDITEAVGLATNEVWSTGISLADVNGDGWLDIYVCKSGEPKGDKRYNELFINQGIDASGNLLPFKEKAREYGIADYGLSTHAAFFDYDKDGDLDMYLLNNSIRSVGHYDLIKDQRLKRDPNGGNKLYRNEGNHFVDISEEAGIYGSPIGFGLGVTIGDVNRDGWQDIFVSNDFFERDYLYINNRNGTFTESLEQSIGEISLGSMGADMADINNDGLPEIFVTEMLPRSQRRLKTKTIFEDWNKYQSAVKQGYHKQFPRNVLQLNRGAKDIDSAIVMSEISRFAGVDATDWSWGALIADLDNDGLKDIFVANGIYKDLTDLDYINFYADPLTTKRLYEERGTYLKTLIDSIPSTALSNFAFKNNGDLTFSDKASAWGLDCPSFSNGSAYADLDNDGDLDLVINNVNMPPFIYENKTNLKTNNNYIAFDLSGDAKNTKALGTQVTLYADSLQFYQELAPMRGYQSNVSDRLVFGLGKISKLDSIKIVWPDLSEQLLKNQPVNQIVQLQKKLIGDRSQERIQPALVNRSKQKLFTSSSLKGLMFENTKSSFVDFDREALLFEMVSDEGAPLAMGDVNDDGLDDVFIGGGKGESAKLFIQQTNGNFREAKIDFSKNRSGKDVAALFFDADQDGDLDLYVASGGSEFPQSSSSLKDRLYFNDGAGNLDLSAQFLPTSAYENSTTVTAGDFDKDGDLDLFVGVGAIPFKYGLPSGSYLLENRGDGRFKNSTATVAPELKNIGMVKDALWADYDQDGDLDLFVTGRWMPIIVFKNNNGMLKRTRVSGLEHSEGLWNKLLLADVNNDGNLDIVAGNQGLNTQFKASDKKPLRMYINDFDKNGKVEQIITQYYGEKSYPVIGRSDLISQLPYLKKKYLKFNNYAEETIQDIFTEKQLKESLVLEVKSLSSAVFIKTAEGFEAKLLPTEVQLAPVSAITSSDYNEDGFTDLLVGGNFYWSKPQTGIYDASRGTLLLGSKSGLKAQSIHQSGINISGEIRDLEQLKIGTESFILISKLNDSLEVLKINKFNND